MLQKKFGEKQAKIVNFCMFLMVQMEDKISENKRIIAQ